MTASNRPGGIAAVVLGESPAAGELVLHLPTGTLRRAGMSLTDRWGVPWVHLDAWPEGTRPEWAPEHQVVDP